ncbi:hypothetical protein W91_0329 [Bifidobacterium animalis subsp. lactis Bi-07]|nr:hypothetical protein W91_0329 [Bifidobacterium animalis subsp. lactis Bi-07]
MFAETLANTLIIHECRRFRPPRGNLRRYGETHGIVPS